jgi:hypothetical protein
MQLKPSWEAKICSSTQEIQIILLKQEVFFRLRKNQSLFSVLSQKNPVLLQSCFSKIRFNIILVIYVTVFLVVSFLQIFLPKSCMHSSLCVLRALPTSSSLTWSFKWYLARSTSYEANHMQYPPAYYYLMPLNFFKCYSGGGGYFWIQV